MLLLALSRRQLMMFYRSKVKRGITFVVCSASCRLYAGGLRGEGCKQEILTHDDAVY